MHLVTLGLVVSRLHLYRPARVAIRQAETAADDVLFGTGRWRHRSNWLRTRSNDAAFVAIGLVLVALAGARLLAGA